MSLNGLLLERPAPAVRIRRGVRVLRGNSIRCVWPDGSACLIFTGCETSLVSNRNYHIAYISPKQDNQRKDTMKQNKEQSSCSKMHNVLASYHHFHQACKSPFTSCESLSLPPSCPFSHAMMTQNYILPPFPRYASQSMCGTPGLSLRPAQKKNIIHVRPCRSYTHHASRKEKRNDRVFLFDDRRCQSC